MQEIQKPWYKNHIFLLMIIIPALSVAGSFFTLYLALSSEKSSVIDSYYKQGVTPGKHHYAHENLAIRLEKGILHVQGLSENVPLIFTFEHPTLAREDLRFALQAIQPGLYPLPAEAQNKLYAQKWYFKIEPDVAADTPHWQQRGGFDPKITNPGSAILFSER